MTVLRALREVDETKGFLCSLERPHQSLLLDTSGAREGGSGTADASRTSSERVGYSHDSCLCAPGPWAVRAWIGNLAGKLASGTATARNSHDRRSQRFSAAGVRDRVQSALSDVRSAPRQRISALPEEGSRLPFLGAARAGVVGRDNTVVLGGKILQIEPTRWRGTLAGCSVTISEHLDQSYSIRYGPHVVGRYNTQGCPCLPEPKPTRRGKTVEKRLGGKVLRTFPPRLEIPPTPRDPHFPTVTAAAISQPQTGHVVCSKKRTF
jgi:hypothetical protein